jgi:hypothetical protein
VSGISCPQDSASAVRHELRGQEELSGEEYKKELGEKWQAMLKMWNDNVVRSSTDSERPTSLRHGNGSRHATAPTYSDLLRYRKRMVVFWDEGAICPRLIPALRLITK